MQEELVRLRRRLKRLEAGKSREEPAASAGDTVEDELRALVKCSQCHERNKNVVITKCFHAFCSVCVDENLAVRNRKCPRCGQRYEKRDVHEFYL